MSVKFTSIQHLTSNIYSEGILMADYRDKLDEWREAARRKAHDLDEKYNIRERVEEGARVAGEAAKRGADAVKTGAERAREEAGRIGDELELNEHAADARE